MSGHSVKAEILLLLVTLIAASGWIFSKESLLGFEPLMFMGLRFLLAGILLILFLPRPSGLAGLSDLYVRNFRKATSLRFLLQTYSLKLAPAGHAAVLLTLEQVWVALFATFWFAERMAPLQLAGCGLIFSAVMVTRASILYRYLRSFRGR